MRDGGWIGPLTLTLSPEGRGDGSECAVKLSFGLRDANRQSTPSPLRGGIKGGGGKPGYRGFRHPLLASPVEGEVSLRARGGMS